MTLENAKARYKLYLEQGRTKEAEDIARNRPEVVEAIVEKPKTITKKTTKKIVKKEEE